jgi:hypothetical protein
VLAVVAVVVVGVPFTTRHSPFLALLGFPISSGENMTVQFSLSRMFQLVAVVAILCSLFASLWWFAALGVLAVINGIACIGFQIAGRQRTANLAGVTALLILAAVGFAAMTYYSMLPPSIAYAWPALSAACVFELATILDWFLFFHR